MNFSKQREKKSRRFYLSSLTFLLVFLVFILGYDNGAHASDTKTHDAIKKLVDDACENKMFSGTVLVTEGNKIIYSGYCGKSNRQLDTYNKLETKYMVGSNTKGFTAALIMQLVAEGRVSLDGTISDYLPYYTSPVGKVKIKHLLEMSSGIPDYLLYVSYPEYGYITLLHPWPTKQFVINFCMPPTTTFTPGSTFEYSNANYYILGAIIEELTKKSYEEVLEEKILDVVKMENTGAYDYTTITINLANGYHINAKLDPSNMEFSQPHTAFSAGYLYSTVGDFLKWSQSLYTDKLLPAEQRDDMLKPHILADSITERTGIKCLYFTYGFMNQYLDPETGQPPCKCPKNPDDIPKNLIKTYFYVGGYPNGFVSLFMRLPHIPKNGKKKVSIMVFSNYDNFTSAYVAFQIRSILFTGKENPQITPVDFSDCK